MRKNCVWTYFVYPLQSLPKYCFYAQILTSEIWDLVACSDSYIFSVQLIFIAYYSASQSEIVDHEECKLNITLTFMT